MASEPSAPALSQEKLRRLKLSTLRPRSNNGAACFVLESRQIRTVKVTRGVGRTKFDKERGLWYYVDKKSKKVK